MTTVSSPPAHASQPHSTNLPVGAPVGAPDGSSRVAVDVVEESMDRQPPDDRVTALEDELFHRAVDGDATAVERLWSTHRRWVAVVLLAHKPSTIELDDLLQEVAMTLLKRIGDVRSPATFRPWLRMVAVNAARAAGRSARIRATTTLGVDRHGAEDVAHGEKHDEAQRLLEMAHALPEPYREPLLLRTLQEMTTRQVAALLDLPETTIETRVSRARRMLRERRAAVDQQHIDRMRRDQRGQE